MKNNNNPYYKDVNFCLKCGTKLKLFSENNRERPICPNCNWIYYSNPIPASSCVILNSSREILLIKRKFPPKAGSWALPSGYIEIDQTPHQAAVCEMKEETNLDGKVIKSLGYFVESSEIYHNIISFGFLMIIENGILKASDDAVDAKFVSLEESKKKCSFFFSSILFK